jgi:uncharacterized protein (TIGR02444 family)
MTDDGPLTARESWAFALKLYAEPGVSDACLKLQAEAGVDVMLLLVATFAVAQRRIPLTPSDIENMDRACRPWREQIVHPLRAIRTTLKLGPAPAPSVAGEQLRAQIKAGELAAESLENDLLVAWLGQYASQQRRSTRGEVSDVLHHVVRHALGKEHHHRIDGLSPAIGAILSATDKLLQ